MANYNQKKGFWSEFFTSDNKWVVMVLLLILALTIFFYFYEPETYPYLLGMFLIIGLADLIASYVSWKKRK